MPGRLWTAAPVNGGPSPNKMSSGKRGRPAKYDRERVLQRASDLFWSAGFSATSLEALGEATEMTRPSLAGAFGDKEAIYIAVLVRYHDAGLADFSKALSGKQSLRAELADVFRIATDLYTSSANAARGCLLIGTASVEAVHRPRIRRILRESLTGINQIIEQRLNIAVADGEIDPDRNPTALASVVSAILHSLAVRARAGERREDLDALGRSAVDLVVRK